MRASGRRIVLISLGAVATECWFWNRPLGLGSVHNDDSRPGEARGIMEYTGKEFCQHVYRACFEAIGHDDSILAIVAMGSFGEDALADLPPPPWNFILRESVPQLDLLPMCDAFVTHGGANSMHEALSFGIPLAVVPVCGDQIWNAETVARSGAGFSFRYPLRTLTATSLRCALHELLPLVDVSSESTTSVSRNPYRDAANDIANKLSSAGGVSAAARHCARLY